MKTIITILLLVVTVSCSRAQYPSNYDRKQDPKIDKNTASNSLQDKIDQAQALKNAGLITADSLNKRIDMDQTWYINDLYAKVKILQAKKNPTLIVDKGFAKVTYNADSSIITMSKITATVTAAKKKKAKAKSKK